MQNPCGTCSSRFPWKGKECRGSRPVPGFCHNFSQRMALAIQRPCTENAPMSHTACHPMYVIVLLCLSIVTIRRNVKLAESGSAEMKPAVWAGKLRHFITGIPGNALLSLQGNTVPTEKVSRGMKHFAPGCRGTAARKSKPHFAGAQKGCVPLQ